MIKVVAITGGIGCGKSTLSKYLKGKGFLVHESDIVVANIYKYPSLNFISLINKCGLGNAIKKTRIDKKLITKSIFNNKVIKNKFEKYIHKEVKNSREVFIKKNLKNKKNLIFVDIPLLFENRLEKSFDVILSIISSRKNRIKRVLKEKKFSNAILTKILKKQTTDKERRARSNIIINNNKTKKDFIFNAQKALIELIK